MIAARDLEVIYARHWAEVVRYAQRACGSNSDQAEDLAQQAFIKLWQYQQHSGVDAEAVVPLLRRVVKNAAISARRHEKAHEVACAEINRRLASDSAALDIAAFSETTESFAASLARMPERRREAFQLSRYYGLDQRSIAQIMGVSAQTVANHTGAALKQLRQALVVNVPGSKRRPKPRGRGRVTRSSARPSKPAGTEPGPK